MGTPLDRQLSLVRLWCLLLFSIASSASWISNGMIVARQQEPVLMVALVELSRKGSCKVTGAALREPTSYDLGSTAGKEAVPDSS